LFKAPAGVPLAWISVAFSILLATRMTAREGVTLGVTLALGTLHWLTLRRVPPDASVNRAVT